MNAKSLIVAGAIGALSSQAQAAPECTPGSPGYIAGWFRDVCAETIISEKPVELSISFSKAHANGQDTGKLSSRDTEMVIRTMSDATKQQLNQMARDTGASPIIGSRPNVSFNGKLIVNSTPDTNLISRFLARENGRSATHALFRPTDEALTTSSQRCEALKAHLTTMVVNGVMVSTEGLMCVPGVKVLSEDKWATPLTKIGNDILDKNPDLNIDQAMISAVVMANNPSKILQTLSSESRKSIQDLAQELQGIRNISIEGKVTTSMLVNVPHTNRGNIAITGGLVLAIITAVTFALRRRSESSQYPYLTH